jgi:predicted nucleic acid-binding protein
VRYLVDSDWVADYLKGRAAAVGLLGSLFPDGLAISIITYGEVYEGIYYGTNRAYHEAGFRHFLRGVQVLSITRTVARRFAIVRGNLRAQGQLIPEPDLLIAATSLHHDLTLVTRNLQHFERIPGLPLYRL